MPTHLQHLCMLLAQLCYRFRHVLYVLLSIKRLLRSCRKGHSVSWGLGFVLHTQQLETLVLSQGNLGGYYVEQKEIITSPKLQLEQAAIMRVGDQLYWKPAWRLFKVPKEKKNRGYCVEWAQLSDGRPQRTSCRSIFSLRISRSWRKMLILSDPSILKKISWISYRAACSYKKTKQQQT